MDNSERLHLYGIIGCLIMKLDGESKRPTVHITDEELEHVQSQYVWIQVPGSNGEALTLRYIEGDDGTW